MNKFEQMDDIRQMILICVIVILMGLVPIMSMWIPQIYENRELEVTNINF